MFLFLASTQIGVGYYATDQKMSCKKQDDFIMLTPFQASIKEEKRIAHIFQGLSPRFNPIKRSQLITAFSARTFLKEEHLNDVNSFDQTTLKLISNDKDYSEGISNYGEMLSKEQLSQLNNLPLSSNFVVEIRANGYHNYTPHFTLIPEVQAEYSLGLGALFDYLRTNSQDEIDQLDEDRLGPGRLYLTVGTDGKLKDLKLWNSSRDEAFDERVLELMGTLPGDWKPAEDAKGNKVEQELVLFFGIIGC
tara:strand:+ start:157 stop:903 length:747 start_codon:yes stop_codon:yes gene_type:complete